MSVVFLLLNLRIENNKIITSTYQKPINLYQYIPPTSAHPPGMMKGIIFSLMKNYKRQNTRQRDYEKMALKLFRCHVARGWDPSTMKWFILKANRTSLCKKRCPSGEDTDCPVGETCFAYTGCKEEKGYGEDPSKWVPGYDWWGNSMSNLVAQIKEEEGKEQELVNQSNAQGGSGNGGGDDEPLCLDAKVTIKAENWPQEITWKIVDLETGHDVVVGDNGELDPGVSVTKTVCLPSWGCYEFVIEDAGGDGLCCAHGNRQYRVRYDKTVVANGAAFYDIKKTEFGCRTEEPTPNPTVNKPEPAISLTNGNSSWRCVANPLVKAGYVVVRQVLRQVCGLLQRVR
ncbi:hypothetical protein ACHAWF_001736 [Thalassiosira exigua]